MRAQRNRASDDRCKTANRLPLHGSGTELSCDLGVASQASARRRAAEVPRGIASHAISHLDVRPAGVNHEAFARLPCGAKLNHQPLVAIVVVNYRTPDLTIAAVQSLRSLTYSNAWVIVVDNASGDGSAERFRNELDQITLIEATDNGGYTAGNNLGIQTALLADAEYVLVVNPDTLVLNPAFLDELVEHLEDHPDLAAVGPKVRMPVHSGPKAGTPSTGPTTRMSSNSGPINRMRSNSGPKGLKAPSIVVPEALDADGRKSSPEDTPALVNTELDAFLTQQTRVQNTILRFPWLWRRAVDWLRYRTVGIRCRSGNAPVDAEALNGVCILFRSECLRQIGLFDERLFAYIEDIDWAYRARKQGWRIRFAPVESIVHLQKESGYERGGSVDYLLKRNTLYFLLRNRRWIQAAGYTAGTLLLTALHRSQSRPPTRWRYGWTDLLRTFARLWVGDLDRALGRPMMSQGACDRSPREGEAPAEPRRSSDLFREKRVARTSVVVSAAPQELRHPGQDVCPTLE